MLPIELASKDKTAYGVKSVINPISLNIISEKDSIKSTKGLTSFSFPLSIN